MSNTVDIKMTVASSLSDLCEVNSSFDKGILRICYTGTNRNGSAISKSTIENCINTIYNCPIVCNYDRDSDTLGGHDMDVVCGSDGVMRLVNLTQPVGVIPESAHVWFADYEEDDGSVHEYLYAEALLWKRQEAYRKIKTDGITAHSMELHVKDGETIDGVYHIKDFEFTAFALIGVTPCFEGSALEMYSSNDFKAQFAQMMRELKEDYTMADSAKNADEDINNNAEGGKVLEEKMNLVNEYGIDVTTLDFSIDDLTVEELTAKFEEMKNAEPVAEDSEPVEASVEPDAEPEQTDEGEPAEEHKFALTSAMIEELNRSLDEITIERDWGVCRRYWYVDCDMANSELYVWDTEDWLLYGFAYSVNGDAVSIDFDSKKRMKYAIVEFDNGEQESPVAQAFAMFEQKIADNAEWEGKYQTASAAIADMETELNTLRSYKANIESEQAEQKAKAEQEKVFANFPELEEIDAFKELKKNCNGFDASALEEKCFAIKGRFGVASKTEQESAPKLKIERTESIADEPYGGIFYRFGFTKNN